MTSIGICDENLAEAVKPGTFRLDWHDRTGTESSRSTANSQRLPIEDQLPATILVLLFPIREQVQAGMVDERNLFDVNVNHRVGW